MPAPVNEGDVLVGKYRVERVLGIGGMGVVVAAHHLLLDERVAIKFLLPEAGRSADAVARFAREARAAAKIHGEHVVRISDVGTLPDGAAYMVMEYLEGSDLQTEIERRGPLPCEKAIELILQALEAMAEAHALGIVHRDLKPANLFLARRRGGSTSLKVLDFGISKVAGRPGSAPAGATATGSVLGTPLYMAPEQWASAKHADARSDIWSLGAILYYAIAGRPPFQGESIPTLWHTIANEAPAPLRALRAEVPPALETTIARCLEKNPDDRFRTVAELASALAPVAPARARASIERVLALSGPGGESTAVPRGASIQDAPSRADAGTAYGFGTTYQRSRARSTGLIIGGGCLVLIAVAGAGWFLAARRGPPVATPVIGVAVSTVAATDSVPPAVTGVPALSAPAASARSIDSLPFASALPRSPARTPPLGSGRGVAALARPASQPAPPVPPIPAVAAPKKPNADKFE